MSAASQLTGDHYVAIPNQSPAPKPELAVVSQSADTRADTSFRSIIAGAGTLVGAFMTAAGVSMLKSTSAAVATTGAIFTGLGAVVTVAGAAFFAYKWYKS